MTTISALAAVGLFAAVFSGSAPAASGPALKVDHASVCAASLSSLQEAFSSVGLAPTYGGPHGNGVTQMALLGFDDGSYLELIAPQKPGVVGDMSWGKFILGNAGPCAWAIGVSDLKAEVARLKSLGFAVDGPGAGSRKRPDGQMVEWETAAVGGTDGAVLPFMIQDKTPRALRVLPTAGVQGSGLTGVSVVVVGVKDLDATVAEFRKAYTLDAPQLENREEFGARIAYFPGTAVMLAASLKPDSWLSQRIAQFGESPVAYLLGTRDFAAAQKKFHLPSPASWFGRKAAWFDAQKLNGIRLGVIE